MRLVLLFVGLLSLLLLNSTGYSQEYSHQSVSKDAGMSFLESGHEEAIWGFEKTESNSYNINETQIPPGKKRNAISIPGFSAVSTSPLIDFKNYNPDTGLPPNFFQHYHSTQSLLQVFLL